MQALKLEWPYAAVMIPAEDFCGYRQRPSVFFFIYLFRSLLDTSHTQQLGISDKLESEGDVLCRRGKLQEMDLHAEQLRLFTESHGLNYLVLA